MSDELTQAPVFDGPFVTFAGRTMLRVSGGEIDQTQDTPAEDAAPVTGTPADGDTSDVNWEKRFKDLQPELTKAQQENARLRAIDEGLRNPGRAAEILQEYGYSFGDEEDPDLGDEGDQSSYQDPRVDAILQERAQERDQAILRDAQAHVSTLLEEAGVEIDPQVQQDLVMRSLGRSGGIVGQMSGEITAEVVNAYVAAEKQREQAYIDRYLKSKRSSHVSPGGTGATETPFRADMSLDERIAAAQEQARLRSEM